jgi:fructokinase
MIHPANRSSVQRPYLVAVGEILWDLLPNGRQMGGAPANVAWHATQLGMRTALVSTVGDDGAGRDIIVQLDRLGIDRSYVAMDAAYPTGTAGVMLDSEGKSTFTITEQVAWDNIALHAGLLHLVAEADAVCVGTLAQRTDTSRRTIQTLFAAARPGCLRVYDVNLRQGFFNATIVGQTVAQCHVVKLNDEEWPIVAGMLELPPDPRAGAIALRRRHGLQMVAITRGALGSVLCDAQGLHDHPGLPIHVVDTVGAGDAFTAAITAGIVQGLPLARLHEFAARAASFVCTRAGATPTLPEDLIEAFGAGHSQTNAQWGNEHS